MRILQINTVYKSGSTGKIMAHIQDVCRFKGYKCKAAYRYAEGSIKYNDTYEVSSWLDCHIHNRLSQMTMLQGCFSYYHTKKFLKKIKAFSPDIIHLHNIHGSYINHPLLFEYIKKHNVPVVWTLHDCWSFTGQCAHFDMIECEKWKDLCCNCCQLKSESQCIIDSSKYMYNNKKKWFLDVNNMTFVTPSKWLAGLVKQSFLKDYKVKVINNGIDLNTFKPNESDFRSKYNCEGKYILLGVAFGWSERKGLDVFVRLAKCLDESYQIVLVGTNDEVDRQIPQNIISIHRTNNQSELAQIYTAADLFVNPTREENYPTVNMEAIACGTPVLTFNTGGSAEILDETCGCVVDRGDVDAMEREIRRIRKENPFSRESCLKRAKSFDMNDRFNEYVTLYEEICNGKK